MTISLSPPHLDMTIEREAEREGAEEEEEEEEREGEMEVERERERERDLNLFKKLTKVIKCLQRWDGVKVQG